MLAQLDHRPVAARHEFLDPGAPRVLRAVGPDVEVVDQQDVDPPGAKALQAVLDRAHDPVIGVVVDQAERQAALELAMVESGRIARLEQAPDLGREHEFGALLVAQRFAETVLGQAETIVRGGVEIADAGVVAGLDRGARLLIGERLVHVAERRPAEAHDRDFDPRLAEHPLCAHLHHVPPMPELNLSRLGAVRHSL